MRFWMKSSIAEIRRAERLYFECRLIRKHLSAESRAFMDGLLRNLYGAHAF